MKRALLTSLVVVALFGHTLAVAAAMTLDSIGVSSIGGRRISSWTYSGKNPALVGTTDPSSTVTVTIAGTDYTATADASGNWSYLPTTLTTTGTYPITLASGSDTLSFTLDLTVASGSATTTAKGGTTSGELVLPDELPQTGSLQQTVLLMGTGLGLTVAGILFYWKVVPKLLFEETISAELEETKWPTKHN